MSRFFTFSDEVERIVLRHLANRFLWIVLAASAFTTIHLNRVQAQQGGWHAEPLLSALNLIVELTLIAAFACIIIWELYLKSRGRRVDAMQDHRRYAVRFHLAALLVLLIVAALLIALAGYLQFIHLLTVMQRGFLLWLTVALAVTTYCLANPRLRGGLAAFAAFIFALLVMAGAEWLVVTMSVAHPAWAQLGDLYYWNQLFPQLAQSDLWLVIYQPWLSWYFAGYAGANVLLYLAFLGRLRLDGRKRDGGSGGVKA